MAQSCTSTAVRTATHAAVAVASANSRTLNPHETEPESRHAPVHFLRIVVHHNA